MPKLGFAGSLDSGDKRASPEIRKKEKASL